MKMLSIYFLTLIIVSINFSITIQNKYENEFKQWMDEFNVIYNNIETFLERLQIFKSNSDYIKEHNEKAHVHGFTLKHNEFSNLTWNEFRSFYFGYSFSDNFLHERLTNQTQRLQEHFANENYLKDAIPESIDWVEKGGVSEVKNQGRCGSCWAFSTTGAIEGAAFVSGNELENLSEQELVDCDPADNGCNGGLMDHAFYWTENHGGLCSENDYKYEAKRGICKKSSCQSVIEVTDFHDVPPNDEIALKYAVAQQPVSVAIEADQRAFQFYSDGVFSAKCGTSLDHGVLVVGYGELDSKKFWKVKNSWGPTWGLNGYILLERDIDAPEGQCGVAMVPSYPIATVSKSSVKHVSKTAEVAHVQEPFDYSKQKLSFQQCGSANLIKFSQLIVDPPAPIRGKSISFKGIGKTLKQFDSASLKLQVKLGGFDIFTASKGTLCGLSHIKLPLGLGHINIDGFQCPRKMGDISEMNIQLTLPEIAPAGKYEIHLSSDNALHDQIFCTKIELSLPEHKKLTNIESPHKRQKVYEFMSEY